MSQLTDLKARFQGGTTKQQGKRKGAEENENQHQQHRYLLRHRNQLRWP
jgi:hypothetical protein